MYTWELYNSVFEYITRQYNSELFPEMENYPARKYTQRNILELYGPDKIYFPSLFSS